MFRIDNCCIFVIINHLIIIKMQVYQTDLIDSQWAKIEKLFDNRKRKHSLKEIVVLRLFVWNVKKSITFVL